MATADFISAPTASMPPVRTPLPRASRHLAARQGLDTCVGTPRHRRAA